MFCFLKKPRGEHSQVYHIEGHQLSLIGTAEVPLAGLYANKIISKKELPIRLVGLSHCFRAETGAGAHSKGLYRLHQFSKVELFSITSEDHSEELHEELLNIQEQIISDLGIPYRLVEKERRIHK